MKTPLLENCQKFKTKHLDKDLKVFFLIFLKLMHCFKNFQKNNDNANLII